MGKLTTGRLGRKRKYKELDTGKFSMSDAIAKIVIMLMGIMVSVFSFTQCFKVNCNRQVIFLFTLFLLIILAFIMERKRQNIMLGILALIVLIGAILLRSYLKVGILSLANAVLKQYQNYYDNQHIYSFRISLEGLRWGNVYWYNTIVICAIIIEYAYVLMTATWHKMYAAVHYIFALVFLALPMVFGLFPPTYVIVMLVGYCILCLAFQHERKISIKKTAYLLVITLVSAGIIFTCVNPKTYKEKNRFVHLKQTINSIIEEMKIEEVFTKGIFGRRSDEAVATGGLGKGKLGDADKLVFENKAMLSITLPLPKNEIYLKGFAANNYNGKKWYYTSSAQNYSDMINAFMNMSDQGYESDYEAREAIMSLNYKYINDFCQSEHYSYSIQIKNLSMDGNFYIPYNVQIEDKKMLEDLMVIGDSSTLNIGGLSYDCFDYTFNDYYNFYKKMNQNGTRVPKEEDMGEAYLRYKTYVEEVNLEVPQNITKLFRKLIPDAPQYKEGDIDSLMACILYANSYLKDNTKYTLKPGRMEGEDFVTDFLINKKVGYCTSYASATVLMLRYMGVPARYAEGYRISTDEILVGTYDKNTKEYTTEVLDSSAHAWTEVYVNGIGFMPVDTTPGSSSIDTRTEPITSGETTKDGETITTRQKESKDSQPTTTKGEKISTSGKNETTPKGESSGSQNSVFPSIVIVVIILAAGLLFSSILIYLYQDKKKSGKKVLNEAIGKLPKERQEVILQTEELFVLLRLHGIACRWGKYTAEYAVEIEELLKEAVNIKKERMNQSKNLEIEQAEPESESDITALEFLELYQQAKYSDENDSFSEEDYKKVINYVDKCKNSLQYLKK